MTSHSTPPAPPSKVRPGLLIILDGFGINDDTEFNAIAAAEAPTLKRLFKDYPHTKLEASEHHVGLPPGFMGNSEVGHLNIGAGRVVYQDFSLISRAIQNETFFSNPALTGLMKTLQEQKRTLHLMGLLSDGGVHSHLSHLLALIQLAKRSGVTKVAIHVFSDGRDTSPVSGIEYLRKLSDFCRDIGLGKISTVAGRFYAMDRDNRWERVEKAYQAIVEPKGVPSFADPIEYLRTNYDQNVTDEFIPPAAAKGYEGMADGDGVVFYNFRADRAREITRALTQTDFTGFKRNKVPALAGYVCMTPYDDSFKLPTAFEKPKVSNTLGELVSSWGWKQLRIAETEKYAHVTYFFNGGDEKVFNGEKRILVPSPREVRTYDLRPEMSAAEVTDGLLKELGNDSYQFAVINFANPDMVGHTGNFRAAVKAVEMVDQCLSRILEWVESHDAFAVITADHGNCEKMQDDTGMPLTSHTLLPVPFIVFDPKRKKLELAPKGKLCDVAPTLLTLWGVKPPAEMTGRSMVRDNA